MGNKRRVRGTFRLYLQWPLFLSALLIVLTAIVGAVSLKAGIIVSIFTLVYIGIALWLYFSRKRGMLEGLISFASAYGKNSQVLMDEMLIPYGITDKSGHFLWVNREIQAILDEDKSGLKNITALFPEVTKEMLATGGQMVSIHSAFGERRFRVDLKEVDLELFAGSGEEEQIKSGLAAESSSVTAVYLIDETQTIKYKQQINDQKMVAGLIYLDNYDEALESVEEVRQSLLGALIERKINKYINSVDGIVKKLEKDKYFVAFKYKYLAQLKANRFDIMSDVKTVNIGNDMPITLSIGIGLGRAT